MKITLLSEDRIRLEDIAGPLTIEAPSADTPYSPFHMVGSGLATCTMAVLQSWATHANVPAQGLVVEVAWRFGEKPRRVAYYCVEINWPGLQEARVTTAKRVATLCAVHNTLTHPPEIVVEVRQ